MQCKSCGNELEDNTKYCGNCGLRINGMVNSVTSTAAYDETDTGVTSNQVGRGSEVRSPLTMQSLSMSVTDNEPVFATMQRDTTAPYSTPIENTTSTMASNMYIQNGLKSRADHNNTYARTGIICGAMAIVAALLGLYVSVLLAGLTIGLGRKIHHDGDRKRGKIAIVLGVVSLVLTLF